MTEFPFDFTHRGELVTAKTDAQLLYFDLSLLAKNKELHAIYSKILFEVTRQLNQLLVKKDEAIIQFLDEKYIELRRHKKLAQLVIFTCLFVSSWFFIYHTFGSLGSPMLHADRGANILLALFTFYLAYVVFFYFPYPLIAYGITAVNWKKVTLFSIYASVPVMAIALCVRFAIQFLMPSVAEVTLFDSLDYFYQRSWLIPGYFLSAAFQEFVTRGVLQTWLLELLLGKNKRFWAIFSSNFTAKGWRFPPTCTCM